MSTALPVENTPLTDEESAKCRAVAKYLECLNAANDESYAFAQFVGRAPNGDPFEYEATHEEWHKQWDKHDRAITLAPVGTGKTTQGAYRLLWLMGKNPEISIIYVSASEKLPKAQCAFLKEEIENNPRVKQVFPNLRREKRRIRRATWSTTQFLIEREGIFREPTFQVLGNFGKVLGQRCDVLVLDDVINMLNSLTDHMRDKVSDWLREVISRLKPDARIICFGHIWHAEDALQKMAQIKELYNYARYECKNKDENGEWQPLVPSVQTLKDIAKKELDLGPVFSELMLYNRLPSHIMGRFKDAWFERCLRRGIGLDFLDHYDTTQGPVCTGVDLGHRKEIGRDKTVMITAAILPDGTRQVIDARSGLWTGPEIVRELEDVAVRFDSNIFVENNSAQQYVIDFAQELNCMSITGHSTQGSNKYHIANGIESIGRELAQGKWILPCAEDNNGLLDVPTEIREMIKAGKSYDPTRHPGDHLMAWWILRTACQQTPMHRGVEIGEFPDLQAG